MKVVRTAMPGMPARMRLMRSRDVVTAGLALHGAEHVVGNVLERDVDITRDLRAIGDGADKFVTPVRGVGVKEANPEIAFDGVEFAEESRESGATGGVDGRAWIGALFPSVHPEERRVLEMRFSSLTPSLTSWRASRRQSQRCGYDGGRGSAG